MATVDTNYDQINILFGLVNDIKEVLDQLQTKMNAKALNLVIEGELDDLRDDVTNLQERTEAIEAKVHT